MSLTVDSKQLQKEYNELNPKQTTWKTISDLNKLYKVDRILLRFAYDRYPEKAALEAENEYKNVEKFYRQTLDRLLKIEQEYLTVDPDQSPYQANKNSTSKFIRDENEHFKAAFKEFATKINENDLGINGPIINQFMQKLFSTQYTAVIRDGQDYFGVTDAEQRVKEIEETIKMYYVVSKDMDEADFILNNVWVEEEEILDFLSYWLKEKETDHFRVLYCRTEEKLKADIATLQAQSQQRKKTQQQLAPLPSLEKVEDKQQQARPIEEAITIEDQQPKKQVKQEQKVASILQRYRAQHNQHEHQETNKQAVVVIPKTKREQAEQKLGQLFSFGCKRRYVVSKSTTFDQIESEGRKMNLEKFVNFCRHLKIMDIVSRELVTELFKMYAFNRLIIDEPKFKTIMGRLMDTDERIVDIILKSTSQGVERSASALSDYKFKLRPVNGKDSGALKQQLADLRVAKSKSRQEKLTMFYAKRQQQKLGVLPGKKKKIALSAYRLPDKTSLLQLQSFRDDNFDPERFFSNEQDELLDAYESKMERKTKHQESGLESVLSRRIERGERVLRKMTQRGVKLYE